MEDSVKDLDGDINPSTPEPRFSIGSKSPYVSFKKIMMLKTIFSNIKTTNSWRNS